MKIAAISDLHGNLPKFNEFYDLILIAGDVSPAKNHTYQYQKQWLVSNFTNWINRLNCNHVVMIGGNHDLYLEAIGDDKEKVDSTFKRINDNKLIFLNHSDFKYKDTEGCEISIFGTPYCKQFGNWAYMKSDEELEELFSTIEDKYDIILSHDAPYGVSDTVEHLPNKHIGSKPLYNLLNRLKSCKWNIHGHLHSSNHEIETIHYIKVVNVSLLDEKYKVAYEPFIFEITHNDKIRHDEITHDDEITPKLTQAVVTEVIEELKNEPTKKIKNRNTKKTI